MQKDTDMDLAREIVVSMLLDSVFGVKKIYLVKTLTENHCLWIFDFLRRPFIVATLTPEKELSVYIVGIREISDHTRFKSIMHSLSSECSIEKTHAPKMISKIDGNEAQILRNVFDTKNGFANFFPVLITKDLLENPIRIHDGRTFNIDLRCQRI